MIAAVLLMALHGAVFVEQEYAGPFPSSEPYLDWRDSLGYHICDLDGDGASDILLTTEVVFQRDGAFRNENRHALPELGESAICQVWNRDIYFRTATRLEVIRWEDSAWKRILSQEIDWPTSGDIDTGDGPQEAGRAAVNKFGGYLHDLDGDGNPEIAVPGPDGVHIYRRTGAFFEPAGVLDIYPPVSLEPQSGVALWPDADRLIQSPYLSRSCSYGFKGDQITVVHRERLSQTQCRYHWARYSIAVQDDHVSVQGPIAEMMSDAVSTLHTDALRLNDDDLQICRVDRRKIYQSSLPMPILEIAVTSVNRKETVTLQMLASVMDPLFVDVNHDGRKDLILQGTGYFDGGLRETVLRATSRRRVDLLVHIHLQTDTNSFSELPDIAHTFVVDLDQPPLRYAAMAHLLYLGLILNLEGDFDGDGFLDAAVHDRPDRVAVFLGSPDGFMDKPYAVVPASPRSTVQATDIDGDGHSDLIVSHWAEDDSGPMPRDVMYLLRDSAP
jgi:hypothetical protein